MTTDGVKNIAETAALISAGGYFLYRAFMGYFLPNVALDLSCVRGDQPDGDVLTIRVTVEKGGAGGVQFHDARAIVKVADQPDQEVELLGISRWTYGPGPLPKFKRLQPKESNDNPRLNLSPGDRVQLAGACHVPTDAIARVEVAILGRVLRSWYMSQWKAADIALPHKISAGLTRLNEPANTGLEPSARN